MTGELPLSLTPSLSTYFGGPRTTKEGITIDETMSKNV